MRVPAGFLVSSIPAEPPSCQVAVGVIFCCNRHLRDCLDNGGAMCREVENVEVCTYSLFNIMSDHGSPRHQVIHLR